MKERVGAIVVRDGALLLVTGYDGSFYWTPGGAKDAGESDEQALRRELREELNVGVAGLEPYCSFVARSSRTGENVRCIYYRVSLDGELVPSEEVTGLGWFSRDDFDSGAVEAVPVFTGHVLPRLRADNLI